MSPFEELGGEPKLRAIVDDFIDRCFDDVMIGFLFARADRDRIKRFEYQHAAKALGAQIEYEGRPLDDAHRPHRILGGQFDRRKQILKETLHDHAVSKGVVEAWISHQDRLRHLITRDPDSNCQD
ncbi:MAG: group 1 truncated hemoglobin [Myxococcales bacterium]|jgi:truncated hemoglobin YjbI|nr:group 1 truncated hemoglobin [Myxococcales bacterium]MDH3842800.1 group 1 truncated hemoglobin [Myxococcales bacterium]